jgi:hypothetical protein
MTRWRNTGLREQMPDGSWRDVYVPVAGSYDTLPTREEWERLRLDPPPEDATPGWEQDCHPDGPLEGCAKMPSTSASVGGLAPTVRIGRAGFSLVPTPIPASTRPPPSPVTGSPGGRPVDLVVDVVVTVLLALAFVILLGTIGMVVGGALGWWGDAPIL